MAFIMLKFNEIQADKVKIWTAVSILQLQWLGYSEIVGQHRNWVWKGNFSGFS